MDHIEKLELFVREKQLKKSAQRNIILDIMSKTNKHLTVDEIHSLVKKNYPDIGIATIYRTVHLLCEAGISKELVINSSTTRYEIITDHHHDHLICTGCGIFIEIYSDKIEKEQQQLADKHGFTLTDHRLMLFGLCPECTFTAEKRRNK